MAVNSKFIIISCALLVSFAAAAPADDELHLKQPTEPNGNGNNQNQDLKSTTTMRPSLNNNNNYNNFGNNLGNGDEDDDDDLSDNFPVIPFPINPFFQPPAFNHQAQPFRGPPRSPFQSLFGNIFEDMRRQREQMMRQFGNLEREAAQGQSTTYFNVNGVAYVKTCTVKRVDGGDSQPTGANTIEPSTESTLSTSTSSTTESS